MRAKSVSIKRYFTVTYNSAKKLLPNTLLVICFGFSCSNAVLADQIVNISPIIVQPEDLQDIGQQMVAQDRINRDQELAIKGLIDDNQRLADTALARQQDATLEKINQTMKDYRDALLSRDRANVQANSLKISKYHDLIVLTENVDDMKAVNQTMQQRSDVIEQKYQILTELRDELKTLNDKLKGEQANQSFVQTPPQQGDKIQFFTNRLAEMDRKIAHYDEVLAAKDQEISQLKNNLAQAQSESSSKDEKIRWLSQVLAATKDKAEYYRLTARQEQKKVPMAVPAPRMDLRVNLARQLLALQQNELALLEVKNKLWMDRNAVLESRTQDLQGRMQGLKNSLGQRTQQVELLKSELENKITAEKDQGTLSDRVQDLRTQLQDKDDQIASLRTKIRSGQEAEAATDSLDQRLADQQSKVDLLKQELENKIVESSKMTQLLSDYQKKLESRDNAYNDQLGAIAHLNSQLQEKEVQVIKIRQDMQGLQESINAKEREDQSQELNLSMEQQNVTDQKIKGYEDKIRGLTAELAMERQQLEGMPSSDEINFLRQGLKKAEAQLKAKDALLLQAQGDAVKYENAYRSQSLDYQNIKGQLQSTYLELHQNDQDLKAKDLEITRLKERYTVDMGNLQDQVKALTQDLNNAQKGLEGKSLNTSVAIALREQLKQKETMLAQAKANADEYARKYKEQSNEFQSLKDQLQDAKDEISRKNEDLKYKNMEILRIKERSPMMGKEKEPFIIGQDMQLQLRMAHAQIRDLQAQLNALSTISKGDVIRQKLKQALDEIDEQGRVINVLVQKLQDAGQGVDLSKYLNK